MIPPTKEPEIKKSYVKQVSNNVGVMCSCISFLRASGINVPRTLNGRANTLPVTHSIPSVGDIVVTYESAWGHAAHVDAIVDNFLILSEANYTPCKSTKGRKLHVDSPVIKGYL